jgi:VanZ family protein
LKKKVWLQIAATAALLGWMGVIFAFSAQPAVQSSEISGAVSGGLVQKVCQIFHIELTAEQITWATQWIEYPVRKAAHMTEYAMMGLLSFAFFKSWQQEKTGGRKRLYLSAFALTAVYAASDEIHQLFVPGRAGRFSDVCIDMAGAAIGLLFLAFVTKMVRRHCEKKAHHLQ